MNAPALSPVSPKSFELGPAFFAPRGHFPCVDPKGELEGWLSEAIARAQPEPGVWRLCGDANDHRDGPHNYRLAQRRARAVAALLGRDAAEWKRLAHGGSQREIVLSLAGVAALAGWRCHPNQGAATAIWRFQEAVVAEYQAPLVADGRYSGFVWNALFVVIVNRLNQRLRERGGVVFGDDGWWRVPVVGVQADWREEEGWWEMRREGGRGVEMGRGGEIPTGD